MIRFVFLFALSLPVLADVHIMHCPLGCPENPASNAFLINTHTPAISNNLTNQFADWLAYEVDVRNFGDSPGRVFGFLGYPLPSILLHTYPAHLKFPSHRPVAEEYHQGKLRESHSISYKNNDE